MWAAQVCPNLQRNPAVAGSSAGKQHSSSTRRHVFRVAAAPAQHAKHQQQQQQQQQYEHAQALSVVLLLHENIKRQTGR
jgi:hypothetical protein